MSRLDIDEFFERQERLFLLGKLTDDLAKYQKLMPNFEALNIPPPISPAFQTAIDSANVIPPVGFGSIAEKLSSNLGMGSLSKSLQLAINRISPIPESVKTLVADTSRLQDAVLFSSETQRAIDQVGGMYRAIDLSRHSQFDHHWNKISDLTKTLGVNGFGSIAQSLALKAAEIEFAYSDIVEFDNDEIESAIGKFSDEGFLEDFLSILKKVKNNEDFKAYGFPIILSFVMLWLGLYIGSLLAANNISEREVKRELKNNSHYYQAEYNDSNFRVIAKNGVRLRTEPKRIEETIIFELSAFTGVTIIERLPGRSPWVKVSLSLGGIPLEGWVATRYLQKIR